QIVFDEPSKKEDHVIAGVFFGKPVRFHAPRVVLRFVVDVGRCDSRATSLTIMSHGARPIEKSWQKRGYKQGCMGARLNSFFGSNKALWCRTPESLTPPVVGRAADFGRTPSPNASSR